MTKMMMKLLWCLLFSLLLGITAGMCTKDVELKYTVPAIDDDVPTIYNTVPISITSQDTSTVTFEISNKWGGSVDNLFVQYVEPMTGLIVCRHEEGFGNNDKFELTAGCMSPHANIAVVHLVVADGDFNAAVDTATPPDCCTGYTEPEGGNTLPAVQYTFTVQCVPIECTSNGQSVGPVDEADSSRSEGNAAAEEAKEQEQMIQAVKEQIKDLAKNNQK
jgi:hypothetical protein